MAYCVNIQLAQDILTLFTFFGVNILASNANRWLL